MKYCTHLGVLDLIMENDVTGENWQPQAAWLWEWWSE